MWIYEQKELVLMYAHGLQTNIPNISAFVHGVGVGGQSEQEKVYVSHVNRL